MFAGFVEKSSQIHIPTAVGITGKTDGLDERFVLTFRVEKGSVNAAEVNEVENGASEDEKGLEIVFVRHPAEVGDLPALVVHGKLTNAAELAVPRGAVGHLFGAVGDPAKGA